MPELPAESEARKRGKRHFRLRSRTQPVSHQNLELETIDTSGPITKKPTFSLPPPPVGALPFLGLGQDWCPLELGSWPLGARPGRSHKHHRTVMMARDLGSHGQRERERLSHPA